MGFLACDAFGVSSSGGFEKKQRFAQVDTNYVPGERLTVSSPIRKRKSIRQIKRHNTVA